MATTRTSRLNRVCWIGCVGVGFSALQGCDATSAKRTQQSLSPPPVTIGLLAGDEFPAQHMRPSADGSEGPVALEGGMTAQTWPNWAKRAWPEACSRVKARRLRSASLSQRQCTVEGVTGYDPVEQIRATAYLQSAGKSFPVVWRWSRDPKRGQASCAGDPLSNQPTELLITRSGDDRNWQVVDAQGGSATAYGLEKDGVWDVCQDLKTLLR